MNENKDGRPTGKLNEDCTMMEVHCYLKDGLAPLTLGTKWIPITDEVKAQIAAQNMGVVSAGASITPELRGRLTSSDLMLPNDAVTEPERCADLTASLMARAVKPGMELPEGVTLIPPTDMLSLPEIFGLEITVEEEEQWTHMRAREDQAAQLSEVMPQRRSTDLKEPENTGFNVNYYSVHVTHPKRPERAPYIFEVEDLIATLNMTFHEGTVLKSLIRSCTERELGLAKQGNDAIRDAQKMVHSSGEHLRILQVRKLKAE